ncbi:MAG: hypothetical protein Q7R86_02530 [bacterium]|nr:hypothetical protein [bacterium]
MRKKILVYILLTVGFSFTGFAFAHAQEALEPAECFDFYNFGSVPVDISPELIQTLAGSELRFYVTATNENPYPIVDGSIYVKVFRKQTDQEMAQKNGGFLVDEFFMKEGVILDAGETKKFDFLWKVPAWAPEGDYQAFTYFQSAKKFDLLGLPFTDDVKGSRADFKIRGEFENSVGLDKNNVKVNGKLYLFTGGPSLFESDETIKVEIPIQNPTTNSESAVVNYTLYWWSGSLDSQKIDSRKETVTLASGEKKTLSYEIINKDYPVYYLVVDSKWNDYSNIIGVRVARKELGRLRINFPGVTSFPITEGINNEVFACLHNVSLGGTTNGKLEISILDENGASVKEFAYEGAITSVMMGLKGNFLPEKSYDKFTLKASLFDGERTLVDNAELSFDCLEINSDKCLLEEIEEEGLLGLNPQMLMYVIIGALILVIIIVIIILIMRKKGGNTPMGPSAPTFSDITPKEPNQDDYRVSNIPGQNQGRASIITALVSAFTLLLLIIAPIIVDARTASYSVSEGGFDKIEVNAPGLDLIQFPEGYRINYSFRYNAVAVTESGVVLNDGDGVSVGSKISFYYDPNDFLNTGSDTSEWVELGQLIGTPFGHWVNGGAFPYSDEEECKSNDSTQAYNENDPSTPYNLHLPLSVDVPNITIDTTQSVTSEILGNCTDLPGGSRRTCDVLKEGQINASVKFENSFAYHYIQYLNFTGGCTYLGRIKKSDSDFKIDIPAQTLNFSFSAVDSDSAIPAPVITGPAAGNPGIQYTFSARSGAFLFEDDGVTPLTQKVRYGFDWNNDAIVDFWTSWVQQGQSNSASFTWVSLGAKTFGVKTQDFDRAESGWGYHTINISNNGSAVCIEGDIWTSCSATCGGGTRSLIHVDDSCATSIIKTETCNIQACGTVIIEVPPGG